MTDFAWYKGGLVFAFVCESGLKTSNQGEYMNILSKISLICAFMGISIAAQSATQVTLGTLNLSKSPSVVSMNVSNLCGVQAIRVAARDYVRVDSIKINFVNPAASDQPIALNATLRPGESTGWVDLKGNERCIDKLTVRGAALGNGQGVIDVVAWKTTQAPGQNLPGQPYHGVIGQVRLSNYGSYGQVDSVNACGVRQVKIRVLQARTDIDYIEVRFGNGGRQQIKVRNIFKANTESVWKDLQGQDRCIQSFTVYGRSLDGPSSVVQLIAR